MLDSVSSEVGVPEADGVKVSHGVVLGDVLAQQASP